MFWIAFIKYYPLSYIKIHGISRISFQRLKSYFLINFNLSVVFPSVISAI